MKRIAFVFASAPHGTSSGREGLDALLSTSALTEDIGVFFISDGVFQLLAEQKPQMILARAYTSTFKILPFYCIEVFWVCAESLRVRGLTKDLLMALNIRIVNPDVLRGKLANYDIILNF